LWCREGKAFCERAFVLHRQQHAKDEQNIQFAPLGKVSADARASDLKFFKFLAFSDILWLFLTCKYNKQKIFGL